MQGTGKTRSERSRWTCLQARCDGWFKPTAYLIHFCTCAWTGSHRIRPASNRLSFNREKFWPRGESLAAFPPCSPQIKAPRFSSKPRNGAKQHSELSSLAASQLRQPCGHGAKIQIQGKSVNHLGLTLFAGALSKYRLEARWPISFHYRRRACMSLLPCRRCSTYSRSD